LEGNGTTKNAATGLGKKPNGASSDHKRRKEEMEKRATVDGEEWNRSVPSDGSRHPNRRIIGTGRELPEDHQEVKGGSELRTLRRFNTRTAQASTGTKALL